MVVALYLCSILPLSDLIFSGRGSERLDSSNAENNIVSGEIVCAPPTSLASVWGRAHPEGLEDPFRWVPISVCCSVVCEFGCARDATEITSKKILCCPYQTCVLATLNRVVTMASSTQYST